MKSFNKVLTINSLLVFITSSIFWYVSTVGEFNFLLLKLNNNFVYYLRFDVLSSLLLLMISILGITVYQYSIKYLAGEKSQLLFIRYLILVLLSISLFILSSNLLSLYFFWLIASFALHNLLTLYKDRPAAIIAARKKLIISRLGDIAIIIAIYVSYLTFKTLDLNDIFEQLKNQSFVRSNFYYINIIACLYSLGALIKSAQFPFHFWLPETMESPTPVSALMHAGIINAGGYLIIRLNPIIEISALSQSILIIVGGITAVFASLVMITQSDIKKKLAYSTISQMGMMMIGCGLSLYSIALFHIVAHSLYKTHAFLSTGNLVQESKKTGFALKPLSFSYLFFSTFIISAVLLYGYFLNGGLYFNSFIYFSFLTFGLLQNVVIFQNSIDKIKIYIKSFAVISLAIIIYFLIETVLHSLLIDLITSRRNVEVSLSDSVTISALFTFCLFTFSFWITPSLMYSTKKIFRHFHIFLFNGAYFGVFSTRILNNISSKINLYFPDETNIVNIDNVRKKVL